MDPPGGIDPATFLTISKFSTTKLRHALPASANAISTKHQGLLIHHNTVTLLVGDLGKYFCLGLFFLQFLTSLMISQHILLMTVRNICMEKQTSGSLTRIDFRLTIHHTYTYTSMGNVCAGEEEDNTLHS